MSIAARDSEESIALAAAAARLHVRAGRADSLRWFFTTSAGRLAGQVAIVILLLAIWQFGSGRFLPHVWVSSPIAIFATLYSWFADGSIWTHLTATLSSAALGYALGSACGVATGLLLGLSSRLEAIFSPFVIALYSLPKVALAPFFVIFLGIGIESKVALVAITVYFLLLYNTLDGLHDLDRTWPAAYRLMGANQREIIHNVLLPGIMPWVFSGLRIAVRYAFTAAVLGELIAGNKGIGFLIENSAGNYNSSGIFAGVLVLVICSVSATQVIARAEKTVLHWRNV
jgi:NitT/TauT family transport system permease protein